MTDFAALKGTGLDAVLYSGLDLGEDVYPDWFEEELWEGGASASSDQTIMRIRTHEDGAHQVYEYLIPGESIMLRNDRNDIRIVDLDEFNSLYRPIGTYRAALKSECVEFFVFNKGNVRLGMPRWVSEILVTGQLQIGLGFNDNTFYTDDGEYAMSPTSILAKGYTGDVRYYEPREFAMLFESFNPYYIPS